MNDMISRQAAIETVRKAKSIGQAHRMLVQLPSAQPGWIPTSVRLPEEPYGCLVTVWDTNPVTMDEFENVLPYFVGWDGEQWNNEDGERCPFEVIAWQPLPTPYREGEKP